MSADRLAELLRQRALLEEHLAWLEREIAASTPASPGTPTVAPIRVAPPSTPSRAPFRPFPTPFVPISSAPQTVADPDADALLDEYRVRPETLRQDVRKGCFIYFAGAFVVLGLIVLGLYFALRQN